MFSFIYVWQCVPRIYINFMTQVGIDKYIFLCICKLISDIYLDFPQIFIYFMLQTFIIGGGNFKLQLLYLNNRWRSMIQTHTNFLSYQTNKQQQKFCILTDACKNNEHTHE